MVIDMKLVYLLWGYPYDEAIIHAFELCGFKIERVELSQYEEDEIMKSRRAEEINEILEQRFMNHSGDAVFSVDFIPKISDFCQRMELPYCSWVLQLPDFGLYTKAVFNPCNYIGICDSYLVEKMWQLGVKRVFYLPDAVELGKRIENVNEEREFCFIAKHPTSVLNTKKMTLYGKGYLNSFLHAQRVLFGANILEEGLVKRVYQEFVKCNPIPENIIPNMQKLYVSDKYLAPSCTAIQQNIFLKNNENIMTIYSNGAFEMCKTSKYSYVTEEIERRKIYASKEFSLVLAPHVLHNAIPRDTLEVIAAGGFPVCGFQRDYSFFFKKDENLVYFTDSKEFQQIIVRYGNHPDERERIKENAYNLISQGHTYYHRIIYMLEMWDKL